MRQHNVDIIGVAGFPRRYLECLARRKDTRYEGHEHTRTPR